VRLKAKDIWCANCHKNLADFLCKVCKKFLGGFKTTNNHYGMSDGYVW